MAYSKETARATAEEWRSLGFYYESDDAKRQWEFIGSKPGLRNLIKLLSEYSFTPSNVKKSEHQHYGPYMYLKITTAPEFEIGADGFRGTLEQFRDISHEVADRLQRADTGSTFTLVPRGAKSSDYKLVFHVRQDAFDPASADPQIHLGRKTSCVSSTHMPLNNRDAEQTQ